MVLGSCRGLGSSVGRRRRCFGALLSLVAAIGCDAGAGGSTVAGVSSSGSAASSLPTMSANPAHGGDAASRAQGAAGVAGAVVAAGGGVAAAAPSGSGAAPRAGSAAADRASADRATAGAGVVAALAGSGAATGPAPTLSQIYETVYAMSCAVCHSMAPNDNQNGMLGMIRSKDQLYAALVNKPAQGAQCAGKGTYIVPGDPQTSLLMQKLSANPSCGSSMPLGSMLQPMQIELFRAWIAAGAMNN